MEKKVTTRIRAERRRLLALYKDLEPEQMELALGLIDRAAWMRIQLEDLEVFLINNGWTEPFRQSADVEPYDRARPQGQAYQSLNSNYQKIVKQLDSMLPEWAKQAPADGFDEFVANR